MSPRNQVLLVLFWGFARDQRFQRGDDLVLNIRRERFPFSGFLNHLKRELFGRCLHQIRIGQAELGHQFI